MNDDLIARLTTFIAQQDEIASLWDGKNPGRVEEDAHAASHLIELAQPLLDALKNLSAN